MPEWLATQNDVGRWNRDRWTEKKGACDKRGAKKHWEMPPEGMVHIKKESNGEVDALQSTMRTFGEKRSVQFLNGKRLILQAVERPGTSIALHCRPNET